MASASNRETGDELLRTKERERDGPIGPIMGIHANTQNNYRVQGMT